MRVEWHGQSAFTLEGDDGKVFIDPFGDMSPMTGGGDMTFDYPPIEAEGVDLLLVTHEHLDHNGAERIVLGPLDDAAVAEVAEDVMEAEPDEAFLALVQGAGGSPFLLMELLAGLRDENLVRFASGQVELVEARLPDRVRSTMRERLRGMSRSAREAATVSASLGRRFSFGDLRPATAAALTAHIVAGAPA